MPDASEFIGGHPAMSGIGGLFKPPEVPVIPDTSQEEAEEGGKKRRKRIRRSREAFQARAASLGPIQLSAPALGGL